MQMRCSQPPFYSSGRQPTGRCIGNRLPTQADPLSRRSWSSLRAGIQSVSVLCLATRRLRAADALKIMFTMRSWKHESIFAEYVTEEDMANPAARVPRRRPSVSSSDRAAAFQSTLYYLQRLQTALYGHDLELSWLNQLFAYVQHLQTSRLAETPDEEFGLLYQMRKWLFWVPVQLLQQQGGQGPALLTLAHFYAVGLTLEPLFPQLGSNFCSALALPPLEAIISVTDAMQSEHGLDQSSVEIASLMQYPRQTAVGHRSRARPSQGSTVQQGTPMMDSNSEIINYTSTGNLSPAFAPSPLYYGTPQPVSFAATNFLEVPTHASFTMGTQNWGMMPSPGLPPQADETAAFTSQGQQGFGAYGSMSMFVTPALVST